MIDWGSLAANSLWVVGCALGLAAFSYTSWQASRSGRKLSAQLKRPQSKVSFSLAGIFFCAGLSLTADAGWMQILWAAMGGLFVLKLVGQAAG
jgi:hypothetical protein